VVGAGLAGIAAAVTAARLGAHVTLLDEGAGIGGWLRVSLAVPEGLEGPCAGLRGTEVTCWADRELGETSAHVLSDATVWGIFEQRVLAVMMGRSSFQLRADIVVIATGGTDVVEPFPGWELPGVLTGSAALRLMHLHWLRPGRRAVVVGGGAFAREVAQALDMAGIELAGQVESCSELACGGDGAVAWADLAGTRVATDVVVVALGTAPDPELAFQAEADMGYAPLDGCFVPLRSVDLETTVPGMYVVGDAGGVCTPAEAWAEGRLAALAALEDDGVDDARERLAAVRSDARRAQAARLTPPVAAVRSQVHGETTTTARRIADQTEVCRCEEVRAAAIRQALAEGATTVNDVKRRTRAGMGLCQGIHCTRTIGRMLQEEGGVDVSTLVPMTPRPPARVIPVSALANLEP
jgi:pyruvate/2-oxoglutarate dehydrogenase complex dihydrolipoamide dehydrogenase (E3) component